MPRCHKFPTVATFLLYIQTLLFYSLAMKSFYEHPTVLGKQYFCWLSVRILYPKLVVNDITDVSTLQGYSCTALCSKFFLYKIIDMGYIGVIHRSYTYFALQFLITFPFNTKFSLFTAYVSLETDVVPSLISECMAQLPSLFPDWLSQFLVIGGRT